MKNSRPEAVVVFVRLITVDRWLCRLDHPDSDANAPCCELSKLPIGGATAGNVLCVCVRVGVGNRAVAAADKYRELRAKDDGDGLT